MAYRPGARLEGLGQTTSWWQTAAEVVTQVAKAAPAVVSAFTKAPTTAAPMALPSIVIPAAAPAPAAPAPAAPGALGGLPTWGWVALGGGALLLVVVMMGMGGGRAAPVYVMAPRRR